MWKPDNVFGSKLKQSNSDEGGYLAFCPGCPGGWTDGGIAEGREEGEG